MQTPYGLSATNGMLYISDWDLGEIIGVTLSNGEQTTIVSGLEEPLGVFYSEVSAQLPSPGLCSIEPD